MTSTTSTVSPNPLLNDPIERLVRRKSSGMMIGILGIMLFFLVDSWFIAFLGTEALAAMSFIMPVCFMVTSLSMGMGGGMSAIVGRQLGAAQHQQARRFVSDSLLLTIILMGGLAVVGYASIEWVFTQLGATAGIMHYITDYMQVWYLGVLFLVIPMVGNAAIRASGNMRLPAVIMWVSGAVNAVLDPIFMFALDLGIQGAALATMVAWMVTFAVSMFVLHFRLHLLNWQWPGLQPLLKNWSTLLKMGIPTAMSQMLHPIAQGILVSIAANFGLFGVAAMGIGMRIESTILIVAMGVSSVIPTVFGQNYGAKLYQRAGRSIHYSINFVVVIYSAVYLLLWLSAPDLAGFFSDEQEVIDITTNYLRILPLSYAMYAVGSIASSLLTALHRPMSALMLNITRLFLVTVPAAFIGSELGDIYGLFWAVSGAQILVGIALWIYTRRLLASMRCS